MVSPALSSDKYKIFFYLFIQIELVLKEKITFTGFSFEIIYGYTNIMYYVFSCKLHGQQNLTQSCLCNIIHMFFFNNTAGFTTYPQCLFCHWNLPANASGSLKDTTQISMI